MASAAHRVSRWTTWSRRLRQVRDPMTRFAVAMDALRAFAKNHPDQRAAAAALRRVTDLAITEARNLARKEGSDDDHGR
jgi:hypothetical protein